MRRPLKLTPSAIQALTSYPWPGNIRELQNCMERVIAVHKQEEIDGTVINLLLKDQEDVPVTSSLLPDEATEISKALALTKGRYADAAKILGISRSTLWRKLKRFNAKQN